MPHPPHRSLLQNSLLAGRGFRHEAYSPAPLLSVKSMFNGQAFYRADRAEFAVDDSGYLILNDRQPYEIQIDSPTQVESFVVFFPRHWAEEVLHVLASPTVALLDEPESALGRVHFFERFAPHDDVVSPVLAALRQEYLTGRLTDIDLEEKLRLLLARMLEAQRLAKRGMDSLSSQRASTREELWRRLNRARDFLRARSHTQVTVSEAATAASLSPFHFLRAFKAAFHETPHEFLSSCRIERAKFLLKRSPLPVTEVCFSSGFESLGSFSSWFRRSTGQSPRSWRKKQF